MDLALNNLQVLICHKTKPNQNIDNSRYNLWKNSLDTIDWFRNIENKISVNLNYPRSIINQILNSVNLRIVGYHLAKKSLKIMKELIRKPCINSVFYQKLEYFAIRKVNTTEQVNTIMKSNIFMNNNNGRDEISNNNKHWKQLL